MKKRPEFSEEDLRSIQRIAGDVLRGLPLDIRIPALYDDLVSAGYLAYVKALKRFDPTRGVPFEKYMTRRVYGAMQDELRRADPFPRDKRTAARKIKTAQGVLYARLKRMPTIGELAKKVRMRVGKVRECLKIPVLIELDEAATQVAVEGVEEDILGKIDAQRIARAFRQGQVSCLTYKEIVIVRGRFLYGHELKVFAARYRCTNGRISQRVRKALAKLRDAYEPPARK